MPVPHRFTVKIDLNLILAFYLDPGHARIDHPAFGQGPAVSEQVRQGTYEPGRWHFGQHHHVEQAVIEPGFRTELEAATGLPPVADRKEKG